MPIDSMLSIGSVHQHLIKSKLRTLAGLMIESVRQYVCLSTCVLPLCLVRTLFTGTEVQILTLTHVLTCVLPLCL